jgi:hypothetical protein
VSVIVCNFCPSEANLAFTSRYKNQNIYHCEPCYARHDEAGEDISYWIEEVSK